MSIADKMRKWSSRLNVIADEMEEEGFELNAEHLDFIIADLQYEAEAFKDGARVTFKK